MENIMKRPVLSYSSTEVYWWLILNYSKSLVLTANIASQFWSRCIVLHDWSWFMSCLR